MGDKKIETFLHRLIDGGVDLLATNLKEVLHEGVDRTNNSEIVIAHQLTTKEVRKRIDNALKMLPQYLKGKWKDDVCSISVRKKIISVEVETYADIKINEYTVVVTLKTPCFIDLAVGKTIREWTEKILRLILSPN